MLKHDCTKASVKSSTEGLGAQDLLSQRCPHHTFIFAVRLKAKWLLLLFLLWFSKPSTGLAPINGKLNLWNKWDCETSVKWSSNHDKCGSVRPSSRWWDSPIPSDGRSHCAPFLQSKQNVPVTTFAKPKKNVVVILCKHNSGFERKRHCEFWDLPRFLILHI